MHTRMHAHPPAYLPHSLRSNVARSMYYELEHLASTLRKLRGLFAPLPATDLPLTLARIKTHTKKALATRDSLFRNSVSQNL